VRVDFGSVKRLAPNLRHPQSKLPPAGASRERVVDWLVDRTLEEFDGRRRVPVALVAGCICE
jgi:hypothetical protein